MADAHGSDTRPGSNQDAARLKPIHQRHGAIENLGWRLVHDGGWIHVQPRAHIADHSDNLGGSRLIIRTQPGTDDDDLPDGIGLRAIVWLMTTVRPGSRSRKNRPASRSGRGRASRRDPRCTTARRALAGFPDLKR